MKVKLGEVQEDISSIAVAHVLRTSKVWISLQQSYSITLAGVSVSSLCTRSSPKMHGKTNHSSRSKHEPQHKFL